MDVPVDERTFFEEYEALRMMGQGSKARVLLVRSRSDHGLRAVKIYSEEEQATARQEARILKGLYHPGIPALYGTAPIRLRNPYGCGYGLVMSFIPGIPLSSAVGNGLPPEVVISYAIQLCDILAYLHGLPEPVLHLDLQPQNILVNEHGRLFLIDFGSACSMSVASIASERFGTADFAAPEIYRPGRLDAGADLYSVGMLMYYMLTGTTTDLSYPIALGNCYEEICRTVEDRKAGESLAEIICRLLYPTPLLRCHDVKVLLRQLEEIQNELEDASGMTDSVLPDPLQSPRKTLRIGICGVTAGIGVTHVALALNEAFARRSGDPERYRGECSLQVTDHGVASPEGIHRMCSQTDCQILLAGMQTWQRSAFRTAVSMLPESSVLLFNFGDGKLFRCIRSHLTESEAKRCLRVPYIPDPYYVSTDMEDFASDVLALALRKTRMPDPAGMRSRY